MSAHSNKSPVEGRPVAGLAASESGESRPNEERIAAGVLVVREGHGANCSSIGSVIDTLFAAAVVGGAVFAAVAAAMAKEEVRVVGAPPPREETPADGEKEPP